MRRRSAPVWLAVFGLALGCSTCGDDDDGVSPEPTSTVPPPVTEPEPEPPDPCLTTDPSLLAWDEESAVSTEALPTSAGGVPLDESTIIHVGESVHRGDDEYATVEEAVAALREAELPADEPIVLALRAADPVTRVVPIIHAFDDRTFSLVVVETDRETECRLLRQVAFGLKTDDDHGWVTFPTARPVSDLLIALGGADEPRRVQLME